MKNCNTFQMTGSIARLLNASASQDNFDKDIQAEAAFNNVQLLFESGYPELAMCFLIMDFKRKHPQSRHLAEVNRMLASIYTKK